MSAGIRLFAREILPRLEAELGLDGFEVDIVGKGDPPAELMRMLARPSVRFRGRIESVDAAFLSTDIQLVPTPFVLGVRVRIIEGFSFGCCVVAHANDAVNMPEMVHEHNALLAPDGRRLAEAVVRAARDPGLRGWLGANGRRTYEQYFSPEQAASPIVDELEQLARDSAKASSRIRA
jgi:glycosyltransferase involved in cell wall biosynthesis